MNTIPKPENEDPLTQTLREWTISAPLPPRFQEQVWRRISQVESEPEATSWTGTIRRLAESLLRPKVAYSYIAVLLAAGIAAGAWTAQVKSTRTEALLGARYVQSLDPFQHASSNR